MARVTVYIPDDLHQWWRNEADFINLSKLATHALIDERNRRGNGEEVTYLCEMCQRRVGLPVCDCQRRPERKRGAS